MPDTGQSNPPGKNEGICFTAGPKGAAFGVGVIHAWLASDRHYPIVAAGISAGALTAAAMQRCYRELEQAKTSGPAEREAARWRWFRQYLRDISVDPLEFLWRAFPDPVDFAADQPPGHRGPGTTGETRGTGASSFLHSYPARGVAGASSHSRQFGCLFHRALCTLERGIRRPDPESRRDFRGRPAHRTRAFLAHATRPFVLRRTAFQRS
jgi:hypothetical protein